MSKLREFDVITQLKSWLSINPVVGCPGGCEYCIRLKDGIESTTPVQIEGSQTALKRLQQYRFFVPNETHLAINNMATDPFLPNSISKKVTFEMLEGLDSLSYKNSVGLITKHYIGKEDITFLENLSNINPIVMVSYSEMPERIEPQGNEVRIKTLENLSNSELNSILYWRPIVEGWNSDKKKIEKVLENGEKYSEAFVISGLTLTERIKEALERKGISPPYEKTDPLHKQLPQKIFDSIIETYKEKGITKPLFKKTSCGVSYLEKCSDYNAHWKEKDKYCLETCPQKQKERCYNVKKPREEKVNSLLKNIGVQTNFTIYPDFIELDRQIQIEEISYLRQNLRFPVV